MLTSLEDYEEDEEGFQFSRVPPKKTKPSVETVVEVHHSDVENAPPKSTPRRGRPLKKRTADDMSSAVAPAKGTTTELIRNSTKGATKDSGPKPQTGNAMRSSRSHTTPEAPSPQRGKRGRSGRPRVSDTNGFRSPEHPLAGTKVALPVADTPIIQRNKELRGAKSAKGRRRSSSGMRGRRASSLIDSGVSNGQNLPLRMQILTVSVTDIAQHYPTRKLVRQTFINTLQMRVFLSRAGCVSF